jgi:uncharacterized protein YqhQ
MMRAPGSFAVVVRRRDGSLQVRERAMPVGAKGPASWPFVRGLATLVESLRLGSEALRFSAEQIEKDLAADDAACPGAQGGAPRAGQAGRGPGLGVLSAFGLALFAWVTRDDAGPSSADPGSKRSGGSWVMLAVTLVFLVALPQGAAAGLNRLLHLGLEVQSARFQAMTGVLKLSIVIGYLLAIRRVPEIRRVFQYHGAEHKTISTYEAGETLTVSHARAKTTFLVMVALVSILVFTAIGAALPRIHTSNALADNALFFLEKLPFLPVLVSITFELQRLFSRYCSTGPLRALLWPGFLVQKITTAEPDDDELEVALASLRVTLFRQQRVVQGLPTDGAEEDVAFPSYESLLAADTLRHPASPAPAA